MSCNKCNKFKHIILKCKCNNTFCMKHLDPLKHDCSYDYKNKDKLKEKLQKVVNEKIEKI